MDGPQFTRGKGCRNRKLTDEDRAEIVRLYTTRLPDGTWMGVVSIARLYGVANHCIQDRLKRAGVKMRSRQEANKGKRCKPIKNLPVGDAPPCKCGCGNPTAWNQRKNHWNRYAAGHYRSMSRAAHLNQAVRRPLPPPLPPRLYDDPEWLRHEYVDNRRTQAEMGHQCGVVSSTIKSAMKRHGIPARNPSESHMGRMLGPKNPAWKGGVANWEYSPDWKVVARSIRDRDGWTCQRCQEQRQRWGKALHVHHIDGNKLNNDPKNLISLCARCHRVAQKEVITKPPYAAPEEVMPK